MKRSVFITTLLIGIALTVGCGIGTIGSWSNLSPKILTQDTSTDVLPLLDGEWKGICPGGFPAPNSKRHCGTSSMTFDKDSGTLDFEFKRDFFDYGVDVSVSQCAKNSTKCYCEVSEAKKEIFCEKTEIRQGACELSLVAHVDGTALETGTSLLGNFSNHYLKVSSVQRDLKYFDDEIEHTNLPTEKHVRLSPAQQAKSQCETFSKDLDKNLKTLVYSFGKNTNDKLYFIGTETGSAFLILPFYSPWMSFERQKKADAH